MTCFPSFCDSLSFSLFVRRMPSRYFWPKLQVQMQLPQWWSLWLQDWGLLLPPWLHRSWLQLKWVRKTRSCLVFFLNIFFWSYCFWAVGHFIVVVFPGKLWAATTEATHEAFERKTFIFFFLYLYLYFCVNEDVFISAGCLSGYYGKDCAKLCSCGEGGQCHPATGKCNCAPGRMGQSCQQGKTMSSIVSSCCRALITNDIKSKKNTANDKCSFVDICSCTMTQKIFEVRKKWLLNYNYNQLWVRAFYLWPLWPPGWHVSVGTTGPNEFFRNRRPNWRRTNNHSN